MPTGALDGYQRGMLQRGGPPVAPQGLVPPAPNLPFPPRPLPPRPPPPPPPSPQQPRVAPTAGVRFLSLSGADSTTFIYDGVNPTVKWNGVSITKMGLPTPTAPAAPTPNGGASIGRGTRDYYRTLKTAVH